MEKILNIDESLLEFIEEGSACKYYKGKRALI